MTSPDNDHEADILRAVSLALHAPDSVLGILFASSDEEGAVSSLREWFGWDAHQARAVLNLQFRRLIVEHRAAVHELAKAEQGPAEL